MTEKSAFGNYIASTTRMLRGDRTLKQAADLSGVSVSYLSDIEQGRTIPTIPTLERIFTAYGVKLTIGYRPDDKQWTTVRTSALRELADMVNRISPQTEDK